MEADEKNKEKIRGEVRPELISEAVRVYHEVIEEYGEEYNIPYEISSKTLGPYSPVYTWIYRSFSDQGGDMLMAANISQEQALNFYQERLLTLERQLEEKYEKQPQVVEYAMSRADSGENFNYSYGIGSTYTLDELGMSTFLITLICLMIAAPIFSSDYASGADDILRCTRHGRGRLALAKLSSAIIICLGAFILCIGAFLVIVYLAFGFDDNTSVELGSLRFLWIGDFVTWSPYVMLIASAVQIPVWIFLTVRSYNKHEAA